MYEICGGLALPLDVENERSVTFLFIDIDERLTGNIFVMLMRGTKMRILVLHVQSSIAFKMVGKAFIFIFFFF